MPARLLRGVVNLVFGVALGVLLIALGLLIFAPLSGEPLLSEWPVTALQPESTWEASNPGVEAILTLDQGVLTVEQVGYGWSWGLRALDFLLSGSLLLSGLWLLRRFVGEVSLGSPFTAGSAHRLRWIGIILVAFPLWQALRDSLWHRLLLHELPSLGVALASPFQTLPSHGFQLQYSIDWGFAVTGVLLLVVAEAFRVGVALREENEEIV